MKKRNHLLVAVFLSVTMALPFITGKESRVSADSRKESLLSIVEENNFNKTELLNPKQHDGLDANVTELVELGYVDYTIEASNASISRNERTKITLTLTENPENFVEGHLILIVEKNGKKYRKQLLLSKESQLVFTAEFNANNEEVSGTYDVESLHFYDETYIIGYYYFNNLPQNLFTVEGTLGGYQPEMDIQFDQETYNPGDSILMSIAISDDVIEFKNAIVRLQLASDHNEKQSLNLLKVASGKLEGQLPVDDSMKNGTYEIESIYLESADYNLEIYQVSEDGNGIYTEDFLSEFRVSGSSRDDTPPEILSYKVDQTTMTLSEVVTFTVEVTDDESGVDELYVTLESDLGEFTHRFFYKTDENTYQAVFNPYHNYFIEGSEFTIHQVTAIDRAGNVNIELWRPKTVIKIVEYKNINEIYGVNRYQTAIEISKLINSSDTVILALGTDFPDALSAGPLAYALNAPILLSQENRISESTLKEIVRREATDVIILGGTSAISDSVTTSLKNIGVKEVRRISGTNRYKTAVAVGEELFKIQALEDTVRREVVLANGNQFADALSAGSMASSRGLPILLTNGNNLHEQVERFLEENRINLVHVVGGSSAVNDQVIAELRARGIEIIRYAGSNRYNTSVDMAQKTYPHSDTAFVASGNQFADALSAAPLAAQINAPILLVAEGKLPTGISTLLSDGTMPYLKFINVVGGEAAVSKAVKKSISEIISTR